MERHGPRQRTSGPRDLSERGAAAYSLDPATSELPMRRIAVASCFMFVARAGQAQQVDDMNRIIDQGLNHSQVMQTAQYLMDRIGGRLTNSPQMRQAETWTQAQFRDLGPQERPQGGLRVRARLVDHLLERPDDRAARPPADGDPGRLDAGHQRHDQRAHRRRADEARARLRGVARQARRQDRARHAARRRRRARRGAVQAADRARTSRKLDQLSPARLRSGERSSGSSSASDVREEARCVPEGGGRARLGAHVLSRRQAGARRGLHATAAGETPALPGRGDRGRGLSPPGAAGQDRPGADAGDQQQRPVR